MWNKLIVPVDVSKEILTVMAIMGMGAASVSRAFAAFGENIEDNIDRLAERKGIPVEEIYHPFFEAQRRV